MRNGKAVGAELLHCQKSGCHYSICQRDTRRHAQSAADADRLAMHEAEIGQHGAGKCEGRGFRKIPLDDEDADGAEHEAGQDRAAAGASAPPAVVEEIISALSGLGPLSVSERVTTTESIRFGLPKEVRQ